MSLSAYIPLVTDASPTGGYQNIPDSAIHAAIQQNLRFLLQTRPGEYPFDVQFGVGLPNLFFELSTADLSEIIDARIRHQVNIYMPYISIDSVDVSYEKADNNTKEIRIQYTVIQSAQSQTYLFTTSLTNTGP